MTPPFPRTITIALITFLLGSGIDYLTGMETKLGLDTLFKIRGVRKPPPEVVIVAIDKASEQQLNTERKDLTHWRGLHAKLIQELHRQGAALIVFDLQFTRPHPDHDNALAQAMRQAGNVILTQCTQKSYGEEDCSGVDSTPVSPTAGGQELPLFQQNVLMRIIPPAPILAKAALDYAPYFLTEDTKYENWLFIKELLDAPNIPVLAWLYYVQLNPALQGIAAPTRPFSRWLTEQRGTCRQPDKIATDPTQTKLVWELRLNKIICQQASRHIDFYGPSQTIRMESYGDVYNGKVTDLNNKVIFVGLANRSHQAPRQDSFLTPFSNSGSDKMAGVEIMATQFANLLEGRFVGPPILPMYTLLTFGFVIGLLLVLFAGMQGIVASCLLSAIYVSLAFWAFKQYGTWLPLAVPLLVQLPTTWILTLLWSRYDLLAERKRILMFIHQFFPNWVHFVPPLPGKWYPEKTVDVKNKDREVNGLCLSTDIEGYTNLVSNMPALEMWGLLRSYYQVLGQPVTTNNGIVANIQGDEMMAIWIDSNQDSRRQAACLAALEIEDAVERFNASSKLGCLPTRIGLHEGDMILGSGIAGGFRFFNPFGDPPAIASRIQNANKHLGTKILASAKFAASLTHIISRPVGIFRLRGRGEPISLLEIVGTADRVSKDQFQIYQKFALGLSAFQQGDWDSAIINFKTLLGAYGMDGPSQFYLQLALHNQQYPPENWDGIVTILAV